MAQGAEDWLSVHMRVAGALRDIREGIASLKAKSAELRSFANPASTPIPALAEAEQSLRLFVEQAPVAIAMFDCEMRYLAASRRWNAEYGLGEASLAGRSHYDVFPETPVSWKEVHRCCLAGETLREEQDCFERADGSLHWMDWSVWPWRTAAGRIGGISILTEDVTKKVLAERALAETQADLNLAQTMTLTGSWRLVPGDSETKVSGEMSRIFGFSRRTPLTHERFLASVHPDDRAVVDCQWKAALKGAPFDAGYRIIVGNETKWIRARAELKFNASGELLGGLGTVQDITAQKSAEEALRQSEELFRGIFENADTGICILGLEGRFQACNPAYSAMLGYTCEELRALNAGDIVHPEDRDANKAEFRRLVRQEIPFYALENRYLCKRGKPIWVRKYVSTLRGPGNKPASIIALITDITESKRQNQEIRLILSEMKHRSKNLLTLVQSVARQTLASGSEDFAVRFGERIEAMAAGQDLLVSGNWTGVDLDALVRSQLAHFEDLIGTRILIKGPPLTLSSSAVLTMGMALHELATNGGKYGALSNRTGGIEIAWRLIPDGAANRRFEMTWTERGGPEVVPPEYSGFGTVLIEDIPRSNFDAEVALNYAPQGLRWHLDCPAESILELPDATSGASNTAKTQ